MGGKRRAEGWEATSLRRAEFRPRTVVDVGVAEGTPWLYEAFPEAFHVLIDPLAEHELHLQRCAREYGGRYFLTAVGAENGTAVMDVVPGRPGKSSFLERTALTASEGAVEKREVPMITLDALFEGRGFEPPFGLKIDAEGFEDEVIKGAPRLLRDTQFVIAELSVAERFRRGYAFSDFTERMDAAGFYLWDILNVGGRRFVDAAFVKRGTPPRPG